ncbi:unnamed protein product [Spirodela intermedia]|uniref:Uncharacterized protein n=1 Tax=Spirodela intermedia TaxID=51605 RepID=A0A7I8K9Y4_SPIIN|nr:unnamed protein product [Spirodela intermedia]
MDEKSASGHRIFQLYELEELRNEAYKNHRIYKEKTKTFHDKYISRKKFDVGQKLETLNSALHGRQPMVFISFYLIFLNFCTLIYRTCEEKSLISKKRKRKNTCCKISG